MNAPAFTMKPRPMLRCGFSNARGTGRDERRHRRPYHGEPRVMVRGGHGGKGELRRGAVLRVRDRAADVLALVVGEQVQRIYHRPVAPPPPNEPPPPENPPPPKPPPPPLKPPPPSLRVLRQSRP